MIAMGSSPRTQSAVKEITECAMLAFGTVAGFIQLPFSPLYSIRQIINGGSIRMTGQEVVNARLE